MPANHRQTVSRLPYRAEGIRARKRWRTVPEVPAGYILEQLHENILDLVVDILLADVPRLRGKQRRRGLDQRLERQTKQRPVAGPMCCDG